MREGSRLCLAMYAFPSSAVALVMFGPAHAVGSLNQAESKPGRRRG